MEDKAPDQLRAERARFQAKAAEWQNAVRTLGEKMQAIAGSFKEKAAAERQDPEDAAKDAAGS